MEKVSFSAKDRKDKNTSIRINELSHFFLVQKLREDCENMNKYSIYSDPLIKIGSKYCLP